MNRERTENEQRANKEKSGRNGFLDTITRAKMRVKPGPEIRSRGLVFLLLFLRFFFCNWGGGAPTTPRPPSFPPSLRIFSHDFEKEGGQACSCGPQLAPDPPRCTPFYARHRPADCRQGTVCYPMRRERWRLRSRLPFWYPSVPTARVAFAV